MTDLVLTGFEQTDMSVSSGLFGANAVFSQLSGGRPTQAYQSVASALDIGDFRFGGGQADSNPYLVDSRGELPRFGENAINTVYMPGDALQQPLVNFLEWIKQGDGDRTATLIIPTKHLDVESYTAFADEIHAFVTRVMADYGEFISAFEIGNEHWEMGETAYGQKASLAAEAIQAALDSVLAEADAQPSILVQMASAGFEGSEFPEDPFETNFRDRVDAANWQIIDQLSEEAKEAIDGVVEHYYFNKPDLIFSEMGLEKNFINRDLEVWREAFEKPLEVHITEWNIRTTAFEQQGLVAGSTLLKQFEHMVSWGVDQAHIWALDFHSRSALTLRSDGGAQLDGEGRLTNSANGAVFDLLSENVRGKDLVLTSFDGQPADLEITAFADAEEAVIYVASRSLETESHSLDLSTLLQEDYRINAVKVTLDQTSTNGRQWEAGRLAEALWIDGAPYYYNEHDADVRYVDLAFSDPGALVFDLRPFEILQITLVHERDFLTIAEAVSSEARNFLHLSDSVEDLIGQNGFDILAISQQLAEVPEALAARDHFIPSTGISPLSGANAAEGRVGALRGGNDILFGNAANGVLLNLESGQAERMQDADRLDQLEWIAGSAGRDTLLGGEGAAVLAGGDGNDRLFGDGGADWLIGGSGNDFLNGGAGLDTAVFSGDRASYTLTLSTRDNNLQIADRRSDGDGADWLRKIEFLDFADSSNGPTGGPLELEHFLGIKDISAQDLVEITELYVAYFNRAPDALGLSYWATAFEAGMSLRDMAENFFYQAETQTLYANLLDRNGGLDLFDGDKVSEFVGQVYQNVFGREPDAPGADYWQQELQQNPGITPALFILSVIAGAKHPTEQTEQHLLDQAYLAQKAALGSFYAVTHGLTDTADASHAMGLFDGSAEGLSAAVDAIKDHYEDALDPISGDFLMPLVGLISDPFAGF